MKIVLIHGQNHKGSTYHIARLLVDALGDGHEIREFFLPRDLNHFCMGCYSCLEDDARCPFYGEKRVIMEAVEAADLLIFTTPNYCMLPSAPMKAFIDLTFTYWLPHRPRACMFGKKAVVISTTAGMGAKKATSGIAQTLHYWGIPKIKQYGAAVAARRWDDVKESKKQKLQRDMERIAKRLLRQKPVHTGLRMRVLFWIMGSMQKAGMGSSPAELTYWTENGWLSGKRPWK